MRRTIVSNSSQVPIPLLHSVPNPLPAGYNQRWRIFSDGVEIHPSHLTLINESQGHQLDWGSHPDGKWSQPVYREVHGGGVVIVPLAIHPDGRVYIGTVEVRRPFRDPREGNTVTELPRGMRDRYETVLQTAQREGLEETGYLSDENTFFALSGDGINPNSTFFLTYNHEENQPDGIAMMANRVPFDALEPAEGDNYVIAEAGMIDAYEGIKRCVFVPFSLKGLASEGDQFIHSGLLRLLAHLEANHTLFFREGVVTIN